MRNGLVLALLAVTALAGCLSDSGDDGRFVDPSWTAQRLSLPDDPMPHGDGHDHSDPVQHQYLWNYEVAAHDPMLTTPLTQAGLHVLDRKGDYLYGGVWGATDVGVEGGLVIWDISDPDTPVETGRFMVPGSVGGDRSMEVTDDGQFAVLGIEKLTCFGQVNPAGVLQAYLIDISDKSNPVAVDVITVTSQSRAHLTSVATITNGFHTVAVHNIGGEDYAFIFGEVYRIDRNATVQGIPVPPQLQKVNTVTVGHDMYVRDTPAGDVWGLAATGDRFFVLYDLNDPTFEATIGFWDLPERPPVRGGLLERTEVTYYFHSADVAFFDDQALIVITSEDAGPHVSPFWILDATKPDELRHIGTWENPGAVPAEHVLFSQHTQRFHDGGVMTLTHYHGGFWQFDFRHPDFRDDPAVVAYAAYAPQDAPPLGVPTNVLLQEYLCGIGPETTIPGVAEPHVVDYIDVEVGQDGIVYIADVRSGLLTFRPTAEHPIYGHLYA